MRAPGFFASLTDEQKQMALCYRGPENHGDPTLAMEEVASMTDTEDRLVERVARAIWDSHELADFSVAPSIEKGFHLNGARAAIEASGLLPLLSATTTFIEECDRMGWGETSEKWLPPSFDNLKMALERVKG